MTTPSRACVAAFAIDTPANTGSLTRPPECVSWACGDSDWDNCGPASSVGSVAQTYDIFSSEDETAEAPDRKLSYDLQHVVRGTTHALAECLMKCSAPKLCVSGPSKHEQDNPPPSVLDSRVVARGSTTGNPPQVPSQLPNSPCDSSVLALVGRLPDRKQEVVKADHTHKW